MFSVNIPVVQVPPSRIQTEHVQVSKTVRKIKSMNVERLGLDAYAPVQNIKENSPAATVPIHPGDIVEELVQMDNNVFRAVVVDENGAPNEYFLTVPDQN